MITANPPPIDQTIVEAAVIEATGLAVGYRQGKVLRRVLDDVTITLRRNRIVGLAGESGCGKSTLGLSLIGYRPPGLEVLAGRVDLAGVDLTALPRSQLRSLWGSKIAYLPQDTSTALNPSLRIGTQLIEPQRRHLSLSSERAEERALELLERVHVKEGGAVLRRYPHQFSGGQQQRIALAIAVACEPDLLILDEPTTGLDVTTQAEVNSLIAELARQSGTAMLYVSHNLALLGTICDDLVIMYGGRIVEAGSAGEVYDQPRHPYTSALIDAVPSVRDETPPRGIPGMPPLSVVEGLCGFHDRCERVSSQCHHHVPLTSLADRQVRCVDPIETRSVARVEVKTSFVPRPPALQYRGEAALQVADLSVTYRTGRRDVIAVDSVSFSVGRGEAVGIAGESGSGKSTVLRAIVGLIAPAKGSVRLNGEGLDPLVADRTDAHRRGIQLVFQNPDSTLNPRHTVMQILERPLVLFRPQLNRDQRRSVAAEALDTMRLRPALLERYARELSGGQRQRVALARAVIAQPQVILCDEVTSALDVSVQATVIELLGELRASIGTSILFVTHDLGVLRSITDRVLIMTQGTICDQGPTSEILSAPQHEYTKRLLASLPDPRATPHALSRSFTRLTESVSPHVF